MIVVADFCLSLSCVYILCRLCVEMLNVKSDLLFLHSSALSYNSLSLITLNILKSPHNIFGKNLSQDKPRLPNTSATPGSGMGRAAGRGVAVQPQISAPAGLLHCFTCFLF